MTQNTRPFRTGGKRDAMVLARSTVMVSCTARSGYAPELSTVPLATALNGIQALTGTLRAAGDPLLGRVSVMVTSGRQGPAAYDLQLDAVPERLSMSRLTPVRSAQAMEYAMEQLSLRLVQATELALVLGSHPEATAAAAQERYAPQVLITTEAGPVLRTDPWLLDLVTQDEVTGLLREAIAPLQQPDLDLVCMSCQLFGRPGLFSTTVAINDHLRAFQSGGPLPEQVVRHARRPDPGTSHPSHTGR